MTPGIVAESDLSGNLKSEYVFFAGERVARKDFPGDAVSYYFSDHLKTASVITNSAGTITEDEDYYPWGGELQLVNSDSNHYKFTGKERDGETGLDYFGARYYGNWLGRFLTPDWAAKPAAVPYAALADPQSLNLYAFVRSRPTVVGDPDGHDIDGSSLPMNMMDKQGPFQPMINASQLQVSTPTSSQPAAATIAEEPPDMPEIPTPPEERIGEPLRRPCICQSGMGPNKPPMPVPGAPDAKWVWKPNPENDRGGRYEPDVWDGTKGSPPGASWEHVGKGKPGEPGHWDVDDGKGTRKRYDRWGNEISPENAHGGRSASRFSAFTQGVADFWHNHKDAIITTGVIIVVGTAIVATGGAAAPAAVLAF